MHDSFEQISSVISRASSFGFQELSNGVKLYGYCPHVGSEAWFHQLHPPLTDAAVESIERDISASFPSQFKQFLLEFSNGMHLFSTSLSIFGRRTGYSRSGDDARQPFCITMANTLERPSQLKPSYIIIGFYQFDGSRVCVDTRDASVVRMENRSSTVLNRWSDFPTLLVDETARLVDLFDASGRPLLPAQPNTPPTNP